MCGIIGVLNNEKALQQVKLGLTILQNRGRDGSNFVKVDSNKVLGHTLHAIINNITQPLVGQGVLTANCEIYNWQELNKKYNLNANNDAELLLKFLDNFGIEKLNELDGVYAFSYLRDDVLYLVRDIIGIKPVWFSYTTDDFSFASEKKVLEKLGYQDIQELNPRHVLIYDINSKVLEVINKELNKDFFNYLPEHTNSYEEIKQKTSELLNQAIRKRIPEKKFGLLFSGGIDSTFLAKYFKEKGYRFTCYTAVLDTDGVIPSDLEYAQKVAKELNLDLKIKKIKIDSIPNYLKKIVPLIEDSNVVKVGVALTFYLACEMAKEDGCKIIFSGLGSEEIFAGYERHKNSSNINQECVSGLRKMYERDLYRDDVLTMDNNLELRLPFLDKSLIEYCLKISEKYKIKDNITKYILRQIALDRGIPEKFSFRKKKAAQYGSRIDNAIGKLAKLEGETKSEFLRQFYPTYNLKLGILFSSGKDSTSAALIMKKQNYELTCLITLKSKNPDSYMFQSAGTELVELQAEAMGLPIIIQETNGVKEEELNDLETAIFLAKEKYQIDGIVNGALFSTYQRDRIEKICDKLGLKIFSPLWHKPQDRHMQEIIDNKFNAIITAVAADGLDKTWIGKKIHQKLFEQLKKIHKKNGLNIAGEGGEFESLVLDCPLFSQSIKIEESDIVEDNENAARLIIKKAKLIEK